MNPSFIWMDGKVVSAEKAVIPVNCPAVQYGLGCFEGIRFYDTEKGPAIFRLKDHFIRWLRSMEILRIKTKFSAMELYEATIKLVKAVNKISGVKNGYIRPWAGFTREKLGLAFDKEISTVTITVVEWPAYFDKNIKATLSTTVRPHPQSFPMDAKLCGTYVNSFLAQEGAREKGFDDAILLDYEGNVAEASVSNIFFVHQPSKRIKNIIVVPNSPSVLSGVTKNSMTQLILLKLKIPAVEKACRKEWLTEVDEIFICGTAVEVMPVVEIDGKKVGDGEAGPITKELQGLYSDVVRGKVPEFSHWLTYVMN